jgi:sialate O-acetylesterase
MKLISPKIRCFRSTIFSTLFVALAVSAASAHAEIKPGSPFTDHAVLQQGTKVPVWGTANPGGKITVDFGGQTKSATVQKDGGWRVDLDSLPASAAARTLKISSNSNETPVELKDVLVGEVWICSGQSNMDFTVAKTKKYYFAGVNNEAAEIAAANYPNIRMFSAVWAKSYEPQKQVAGIWKLCTPENVPEFSAIGYFFARDLQQALKVPVGIITCTFGASTAQAWIRREAITANPKLKPVLDEFDAKVKSYVPTTPEQQKQFDDAVAQAKAAGKRGPRNPNPDPVQDQHNPTVLFNGMIAPIIPYAMQGVLWYQGESITAPKDLFPLWNATLIKDWRGLWDREFPFYFCQLAALNNPSNSPQVRAWQSEALQLPKTAMAVTIDIGDPKNVHPKDKQDVGLRLTKIALAETYGKAIEDSGPQVESASIQGAAIRVTFSHAEGGLVAKGGPIKTLEIAGSDGKFVPTDGTINGQELVVKSAAVAAPVAVRYAWANYPDGCNLYNQAGLPAAPFSKEATAP